MSGNSNNIFVGDAIELWWSPTKGATLPVGFADPAGDFVNLGLFSVDEGFTLHTQDDPTSSGIRAMIHGQPRVIQVRTPSDTPASIAVTALENSQSVKELATNAAYTGGKATFTGALAENGSLVVNLINADGEIERFSADNVFPICTSDLVSNGTDANTRALKYAFRFEFDYSENLGDAGGYFDNDSEPVLDAS